MEHVILVDEDDREVGHEEKLRAHVTPRLHRAVSVYVCNSRGHLLMQQRATAKYHSPGLWSNTCCGHPRPGEPALEAAHRRLAEELGVECLLHPTCALTYKLNVGAELFEHELTHIFVGVFDGSPRPDPAEVSQWKWVDSGRLRHLRSSSPSMLTPWFDVVLNHLQRWAAKNARPLPPSIVRAIATWE